MSEELKYKMPEDKEFNNKRDMYNSWLEQNNLSHWESLDNLGIFFIRSDDKEYNTKYMNILKIVGYKSRGIIEQLKEFDKMYPIKNGNEEALA